jgi:hypothetical protein
MDVVKRDKCILINGNYKNVQNRDELIEFICGKDGCEKKDTKCFRWLEKYGAFCHECSVKDGVLKGKQTFTSKYGVDNPQKCKDIKNKTIQTCLQKYGAENPMQNEDVRNKGKQTNVVKYGVENPFQSQEIKEKIKSQNIAIYGVEYTSQRKDVQDRIKQTNLEKYGVQYLSQNAQIFQKQLHASYKFKDYTFPNGEVVKVQGYEPMALDTLLQYGYAYDDLVIDNIKVAEIWYEKDGKKHRYFCDIYIPKEKTIIEVKSDYTYKVDKLKCDLVRSVCNDKGIMFYVWVFNKSGELVLSE